MKVKYLLQDGFVRKYLFLIDKYCWFEINVWFGILKYKL